MQHKVCGFILIVSAFLVCTSVVAPAARAEEPKVIITGGADETQHEYTWRVANRSSARMVRIEFPHYAADLFIPPDGWRQGSRQEMNLVRVGWDFRPGLCWAEAEPGFEGLGPGLAAVFQMRVGGALRSAGTVTVKFDDGTQVQVAGVELPTQPPQTSPWVALVGIGLIFALFIVYHERRRRKASANCSNTDVKQETTR